jgi:hypothetical protein
MKPGFWDYVRAAFHARPIGMLVPPNWIGVGAFGLLGLVNPGFWIIGAGLELAYLGVVATHPRFQRLVGATRQSGVVQQWQRKLTDLVSQLDAADQRRYRLLEARCRAILDQQLQGGTAPPGIEAQQEGLGRLAWIYLKLLWTRQSISRIVREAAGNDDTTMLDDRIAKLEARLKETTLAEELRRSLTGQLEILQQRLARRKEAREKLAFLDAELTRLEEQVELIREQAVLATSPDALSERIDQITTNLGGTTQWIQEQQQIYGAVEDLLSEPPPITLAASKESQ